MGKVIYFRLGNRDRISVRDLLHSVQNIIGILENLDASISEKRTGTVRWEIAELRTDSPPLVGIEGYPISNKFSDPTPIIEEEIVRGLDDLTRTQKRNRYYSDSVLSKVRNLAVQSKRLGPLKVYTADNLKNEALINEATFQNIEQLIGIKYKGIGSVIGSLDAIIVHKKNEFRIWDDRTGKPVTCLFPQELFNDVKKHLKQKVLVYGEVHSNPKGEPVSIIVNGIEPRDPNKRLPTIKEMSGLVKNMYEGKTLKDYLEDIKND